jgi:hypothetical protein
VVDVKMTGNTKLTEVIVTGTTVGTDKRKVAIDVQAINSKSLPSVPVASVDQALIGKVAGAQISNVNGTSRFEGQHPASRYQLCQPGCFSDDYGGWC